MTLDWEHAVFFVKSTIIIKKCKYIFVNSTSDTVIVKWSSFLNDFWDQRIQRRHWFRTPMLGSGANFEDTTGLRGGLSSLYFDLKKLTYSWHGNFYRSENLMVIIIWKRTFRVRMRLKLWGLCRSIEKFWFPICLSVTTYYYAAYTYTDHNKQDKFSF